jgi:hypothetical protein
LAKTSTSTSASAKTTDEDEDEDEDETIIDRQATSPVLKNAGGDRPIRGAVRLTSPAVRLPTCLSW